MAVEPARHLFTVEDLHRMADAGIFASNDRVELIDGEIFEMAALNAPHAGCVNRFTRILVVGFGDQATVGVQNPVILDDLTQPQPDLWVARPRQDAYGESHPQPDDLLLVVEVADTSAALDRRWKIPRYARAGVAEAWLADLRGDRLEVYREPGQDGYGEVTVLGRGDIVSPLALPALTIPIDDVLGPRTT